MERGQDQLALAQVLRPVQDEDRMRADQGLEDRGVGLTGTDHVIVTAEDGPLPSELSDAMKSRFQCVRAA